MCYIKRFPHSSNDFILALYFTTVAMVLHQCTSLVTMVVALAGIVISYDKYMCTQYMCTQNMNYYYNLISHYNL